MPRNPSAPAAEVSGLGEARPYVPEAEALGSWYCEKLQSGCLGMAVHRLRDCGWTRSFGRTEDGSTCRKSGPWSWVMCLYGEPELKLPPDGVTVPGQGDKENTGRRVKVFNPVGKSKAPQTNTCLEKDRETETETQKIQEVSLHPRNSRQQGNLRSAAGNYGCDSPSDNKESSHVETFFVKSSWWRNHSVRICWVPAVPARALDVGDSAIDKKSIPWAMGITASCWRETNFASDATGGNSSSEAMGSQIRGQSKRGHGGQRRSI